MQVFADDLNNIRLIGIVTLVVFLIIIFIGTAWEAKVFLQAKLSRFSDKFTCTGTSCNDYYFNRLHS